MLLFYSSYFIDPATGLGLRPRRHMLRSNQAVFTLPCAFSPSIPAPAKHSRSPGQ